MNRAEQGFQISLCEFLELNGLLPVAVPNEGKRSRIAGHMMKRAGLRTGFPDLLIFDRRAPYSKPGDVLHIQYGGQRGSSRRVLADAVFGASKSRGLLCVAENKSKRGALRADQTDWVDELRARGVPVFGPWRSIEDAVRDLESIDVTFKVRV